LLAAEGCLARTRALRDGSPVSGSRAGGNRWTRIAASLARANSGGSLLMSLQVQTTDMSERWSFNHVRNVPNSRAQTPLSVAPELPAPRSAFSISSIINTHAQFVALGQFAVFGRQAAGQVLQLIAVGQLSSE
jgi:hypothetical protein